MLGRNAWSAMAAVVLIAGMLGAGVEEEGDGRLKLVESVRDDNLASVSGLAIDPEARFLYAAAWRSASIMSFTRDAQTGKLLFAAALQIGHDRCGLGLPCLAAFLGAASADLGLDRHRACPEMCNSFARVGDGNHPVGAGGDDLLTQHRAAGALDCAQGIVDLVDAVDA